MSNYGPRALRNGRPRCFPTPAVVPFNASTEIPRHLSILVTRWPPKAAIFQKDRDFAACGLHSGPTSIAYMLYTYRSDLPERIEGKSPVEWAKQYLNVADELWTKHRLPVWQPECPSSRDCGVCMEGLSKSILKAIVYQDATMLDAFWDSVPAVLTDTDETNDEWAIGRAGFLFFSRFIRTEMPQVAERVRQIEAQVIDAMLPRSPWLFRDVEYVGLGHGHAGNVAQILLSTPISRLPEIARQLRPMVTRILDMQDGEGNWPTLVEQPGSGGLLQMSHGAPGILVCCGIWRQIYEDLHDPEIVAKCTAAIENAQEEIWLRGYLTKESSLLHGAAGNSLVLLDSDRRASFLAVSVQETTDAGVKDKSVEPSNGDSGLQKGIAGRIAATIEYQKGTFGTFASFNDY